MEIRERVYKVLEKMNVNPEKITDNASFKVDLQFDSIDIYDFIDAVQDEFSDMGLEIDDKEILSISSVGDAVSFIEKKVS